MSLNLTKGQKVSLTKEAPGLNEVIIGLGWDVAGSGASIDLDASVVELNGDKKYQNLVYFARKKSAGIKHAGDNLTGAGDGDDEQIFITLGDVTAERLKFAVNIYQAQSKGQNFGQIENAFVRIVDKATNKEILKYDLSEDHSTATGIVIGELYKHNGEWKFAASEEGFVGDLNALTNLFK